MPLVDIAAWIANRGLTGRLTVRRAHSEEHFDIENGAVVRAASTDPRYFFGQFFLHFGLISEDELERAYITQTETQVRLGRILVMIGQVPEEQVMQMLRLKITESMLNPFRWHDGGFVFDEALRSAPQPEVEVGIPLGDICTEGVARAELWTLYDSLFPSRRASLWVAEDVAQRVPADSTKGRILELGRRKLSLESIALELHASDFQLARHLVELHQIGAVQAREPAKESFITGDLAGLDPQGTTDIVHMAETAMAQARYGEAQRWLDMGLQRAPEDPQLQQVAAQLREITGSGPDTVHRKRPALTAPLESLGQLSAKQRYILGRVDGQRTVRAIMQVSPMRDAEAMEVILDFVESGALVLQDLAPAPSGQRNPTCTNQDSRRPACADAVAQPGMRNLSCPAL